jgi:hypothetical protein
MLALMHRLCFVVKVEGEEEGGVNYFNAQLSHIE